LYLKIDIWGIINHFIHENINDTNCTLVLKDVPDDSLVIDSQCPQCPNNTCFCLYNSQENVTEGTSDVQKDIPEEEQIDTENDSEDDIEHYNKDHIKDYIDDVLKSENVSLYYSGLYNGEEDEDTSIKLTEEEILMKNKCDNVSYWLNVDVNKS